MRIVCSPGTPPQARSCSASATTACNLDVAHPAAARDGADGVGQEATSAAAPVRSESGVPPAMLCTSYGTTDSLPYAAVASRANQSSAANPDGLCLPHRGKTPLAAYSSAV